ncbi:unnamed protein product [Mesocestoides corti]|uniref:TATA box binding protein associated factor (TAF) histone-like fold domain-containing protein n=1 Tax=Mesocestoides corti TaxID=53468 RepID=A0A0R3U7K0_MESCO|nr:unnamed protein product [Mesocestoides corti]
MEASDARSDENLSPSIVIKSIFEDFNLSGLSDDVYLRVLDIVTKYTGEILVDAKCFATYAGRPNITEQDIILAVDSKIENIILAPLHRGQLLEYAEKINSQPLPAIKPGQGIKLAPEKYTLTAPNFCINSSTVSGGDANVPSVTGVASRLVLPSSNLGANPGGVAVYRVSNTPGTSAQGQRPSLIPVSSTSVASTSDSSGSGIHVIAPVAAPASLIRVQSSNFTSSGHPLVRTPTPNSINNSELGRCFSL